MSQIQDNTIIVKTRERLDIVTRSIKSLETQWDRLDDSGQYREQHEVEVELKKLRKEEVKLMEALKPFIE